MRDARQGFRAGWRLVAGAALMACAALTGGCSSGDDEEESFTCEKTDRSGTYFVEYETVDGNCGDIPSSVGRLDDATALPDTCAFDAPDRWSDGDCKLERAYSCEENAIEPGATSTTVAVTEQRDAAGDMLAGTLTMTVKGGDGGFICSGTYRFSASRQ